ncbi:MAG: hypothetical protein IPJ30_12000 [Acidobacteria bacterium]|nr:hypothetical protein [Acidobacteriota bacterium]
MYSAAVIRLFFRGNADFGFVSAFLDLSDNSVHHEFFGSVTAILGGFYTLFLGGVYLPTALIIQKRAERLVVPMPGTGETTENLLSSYGFTFSIRDAVPKVLALAGHSDGRLDGDAKQTLMFATNP